MYITTQDKDNIVSFITGYEIGSTTCDFSDSFKKFIDEKFKIRAGATSWPGQIQLLSEKLAQTWTRTFKRTSMQFIVGADSDALQETLSKTVKTRIDGLIKRIGENGDPWFNEWWTEEWMSLCLLNFDWFKNLWTSEELKVVQAIDNVVTSGRVFSEKGDKLPSRELISLRKQVKWLT